MCCGIKDNIIKIIILSKNIQFIIILSYQKKYDKYL